MRRSRASLEFDRRRDRAFEGYYSPGPVAEQGLRAAACRLGVDPEVVVDLGAGGGVMGQRVGLVFPKARRIGVEIRPEMAGCRRHYDEVLFQDLRSPLRVGGVDLVVANPPYSLVLETLEVALQLLRAAGVLLLLLRASWGCSNRSHSHLQTRTPLEEWPIPGRVNFLELIDDTGDPAAGDNHSHKWLVWRRGYRAPRFAWLTAPLPALPAAMTRWEELPGAERHPVEPIAKEFWS